MAEKPKKLPPHDSWITIAPGEKVEVDAAFQNKWRETTERLRAVRGHVLAACFEIEFSVDSLIAKAFFPEAAPEPSEDHREYFDELLLKGPNLTFRSKIDLLGKMRTRFDSLAQVIASELVAKLHQVRDIRNRFAHYPVAFKQVKTGSGELDISATLECRDASIELSSEYLEKLGALLGETQENLQNANKELSEKQKPAPAGA